MNLCIDHLRRNKRRPSTPFEEELQSEGEEIHAAQHFVDPFRALSNAQLGQTMAAALQLLSEDHRMVLVLRELEELSYEEIAEVVNAPKGTVMSRLFHARAKLREILSSQIQEHQDSVESPL